jgi:hypothetical protein
MCTLYIRKMRKIATANGVYARTCGPCRFAFNPRSYRISIAWTAGRPRRYRSVAHFRGGMERWLYLGKERRNVEDEDGEGEDGEGEDEDWGCQRT